MQDIPAIVQNTELSHFPGFVFQFSVWMNDVQCSKLFIEFINLVYIHVTPGVFWDVFIVAFPEMNADLVPAKH